MKNFYSALFLLFSLFVSTTTFGIDYYWVGGSGNWSDINRWSLSDGGAGGAGVPGVNDNCFFTDNSFSAANQTVTLNIANANCNNMTWTVTTNSPTFASSSSANNLNIYGNLSMVSTQGTWATGMNVYFMGTGTKTINSGGKNFGPVYFAGTGTWSNQAAWNTADITVSQAATLNFTNNITMQQLQITAAANITFSALATMNSSMNINSGATVNFLSTSSGTNSTLTVNGAGAVLNFNANRTINNGLNLYNGTINTNGTTCTWGSFYSVSNCNNAAVRALNLGSSTVNVSGSWSAGGDPGLLTITPGTSTINMTGVGATFNNYQDCFTPNTTHNYYNVNFTATSGTVQFQHHYINSTNKVNGNYNQVSFGAGANITGDWTVGTLNFALNGTYTFQAGRTATVNTLFNANATCAGPMTIKSGTAGTQAIISKANATVTMNYCNLQDLNFTGGATATATNSINQGNNTGVTIQAGGAAASRTLYWVGGSGNWNDINRWSLSSGGAGGECPPTSIDDVVFNNSSFSAVNQTVTLNVPNADCNNMTWTVTTNSPTFASSSSANNLNIYGNLSMVSTQGTWATGMNVYFMGTGTKTINSGGKNFGPVYFAGTGTWSNQAAWNTADITVSQAATLNFTNNITMQQLQITAAANITFSALATMNSSMNINSGATVNFLSTSSGTNSTLTVNGAGAVLNFNANRTINNGLNLYNGTINTNGTTCTWGSFYSVSNCNNAAVRALNLGSSTVNVSGSWSAGGDPGLLTITPGTSTINMTGVGATFNNYQDCFTPNTTHNYNNVNFTATSGTVQFQHHYINSTNKVNGNYNQVSFGAGANITGDWTVGTLNFALNGTYTFQAGRTATVNTLFNANATCAGPMTIKSGTAGTQAIISKANATVTMNYCNLQDLNFTGGATATATNSINQGNNTGVTIQAGGAAASRTLYWVGGSGNWNDINRWSLSSGGAGGECPPTSIDDVVFNNSSFSAVNQTVTLNVPNADCNNMTWTVTTNSPTFASSSSANNLNIYGNLSMVSTQGTWATGMNVYFMGTGTKTINSGGKNFGPVYFAGTGTWSNQAAWNTADITVSQAATLNFTNNITMQQLQITAAANITFSALATMNSSMNINSGATVNFLSTSSGTNSTLTVNGAGAVLNFNANRTINNGLNLYNGTINTNGTTCTWGSFYSVSNCNNAAVRALNLGSSTVNVSGSWSAGGDPGLLTITPGTSTINMTGVGATFNNYQDCFTPNTTHNYYNVNFTATSGTVQFQHHYINSTNKVNGNYNQVSFGAGANITGDWTVGTLLMTSNNTYNFQAGRTATITNNISFGSICFGGVTLQSATVGTQAIITKTSGTVNGQNLTIKDINATGGATYNAYGSTNMGNNTGWNFLTTQTLGSLGQISTTQNGFSVSPIAGAVSYTWTLPAGSNFLSGQGTTNISSSNVNGQVCVTASNGCGSTTAASCINTGIVSIDLGGINNTNVCQGTSTVNRTYIGTNGSPNVFSIDFDATANSAGITDVVNANITTSPLTFSIPNNIAPGVYNGVLSVTNTTTAISSINYNITVSIVGNPTVTITSMPSVCQGTTTSTLVFSGTTNTPNQYSIDYDPTANAASFVDVVNQTLLGSPIPIVIPAGASPANYNANLTIVNTTTACQGVYPFTIAVNAIPSATFGVNPSVVVGTTSSSIALTNMVGSPNQYSINYDATANTAGFIDLFNQNLAGNSIPITIPAGASAGTYNATVSLTNSNSNCSSSAVAITVTLNASAPPTITLGSSPSICTGTTNANLTYSSVTNNPNEYTIDFDATANTAGLNDVAWITLPASPIGIPVPGNIAAGTYNGTINVRNTVTNISGTAQNFTLSVGTTPSITLGLNPSVSVGATSTAFSFTTPIGSPNLFTLDFNTAANTAGFNDQINSSLVGSTIPVSIPAGTPAGNYIATLVVTNSTNGCSSPVYNVAISIINGISYYWVGGSGNWSDINRWSTTDGGAGGAGVPGVNDNVYFTNNSFSAPNQTVTLNLANANCVNMYWTVTTNTPNFASTSSANNLNLYGSIAMVSTQGTWTTGMNVYFLGNGLNTINSGGKTFGPVFFNGTGTWSNLAAWTTGTFTVSQAATLNFTNNITTGTTNINAPATLTYSALCQVNGDYTTSAASYSNFLTTSTGNINNGLNINGNGTVNLQANRQIGSISLGYGILSTNGTTQTWGSFSSTPCCNSDQRVLNLGSSTINCSGIWQVRVGQNLTVNAGTSQINMTATNTTFNTMSGCCEATSQHVYNNVSFTATSGTVNFYHFYNNSSSLANSSYNQVTFAAGANITGDITVGTINFALNGTYNFQAGRTVTVTTLFNANANCAGPITLKSATAGTQAIISKATASVNMNYCNLQDMSFIGGSTATATNSINQGNNTGVTIQAGGSAVSRTLYWVGGSGNWNDINRWSLSSGGAGGQCPPTSIDDVIFDNASFSAASQTVTINVPNADCRDMTWTVTTNTPNFASTSSANNLNLYGNIAMVSTQGTWATGINIYFMGTGTKTINSGGKTFGPVFFNGTGTWSNLAAWTTGTFTVSQAATLNFTNNITTGTTNINAPATLTYSALCQVNGDYTTSAASYSNFLTTSTGNINNGLNINGNGTVNLQANRQIGSISLGYGILSTNGTTQTWGSFSSTPCCNSDQRVLNLGSSTINCSGIWQVRVGQNLTVNAGTSQINMTATNTTFNTMSGCCEATSQHVYNNVSFTATSGTVNFYHFYNNSSSLANSSYNQVTFAAGANITGDITVGTINFALNGTYNFQAGRTVTVTTLFNANANCAGPITLKSATAGTQAIISKATASVNMNYCNLQDMSFIGGSTATATNSINQGNNTGVTIQAGGSAVSRTLYWVGGSGNWNDINRWSLSSGGAGGQCPPTSIDDVIFDNASFSAASQTVTINVPNADCRDMTWTVTTNTPNFASTSSANNLNLYGNIAMVSTQGTWATGINIYFMGTGTKTINSGGKTFGPVFFNGTGTWSNLAAWTTGTFTVSQAATLNFTNNITTGTTNINAPATLTYSALCQVNGDYTTSAASYSNFLTTSTGNINNGLNINGNGTVNLQANRQIGSISLGYGILSTNGTTQTWGSFSSTPCCNSDQRVLNLGSSTINCSGIWQVRVGQNLTVNAGTSQINMTATNTTFNTMSGCCEATSQHVYNNVSFTATSGTVNFYHFYNNSSSLANSSYNQVTFAAGANITGDITIGTLSLTSNNTYNFQAGRTVTITNNIAFNSVCFGGVTIQSATAGAQAFLSKVSGTVSGQNLTIKDMNAGGGATYTAYGSTNMGNNTGWTFASSPTLGTIGSVTATGNGFTVPTVTGAVSYSWTLPAGATLLSGQGTNTIVASVPSGQVCVTASNGCGSTTSSSCFVNAIDYITLNNMGVFVSEDFNSLANSGTSSTFPLGWRIYESGANANTDYTAGTGASNTGDSYSFGIANSNLRTLGGVLSSTLTPSYGAKFLNNTNAAITSLTVTYVGETWRVGATNRTDKIDFQYSTNANDLSSGTWVDVDSLDYQNLAQGTTSSGTVIHSSSKNFTIFGLNIPANSYFFIRWLDSDATGSDDGIGINDFSIKPCFTVAPPTTTAQAFCGGSTVANLSATGNAIAWYATSSGNSPLGSTTVLASGTYFASQTVTGCESQRTATSITINALPTVGAGANQTICAGTQVTLSGSGASTYSWNNGVTNAVAFTPNATTTYTVTGTAANGCTNTAQTTVTVNALPTVGAGANQTVCAGAQVTLSGSGASTYTWDNGITNAVAFTPNATTTYTVTGTAANGCTNTAQTTVTVNALPTVGAGANQTVCAGAQVTLSGSGASTYTWDNGITNAVAFTPNATTTYTVTGTAANGCTNTAQTTVTVNALPTVGAGANQTVCAGAQVTLSGSGASTYTWDNGVTNAVAFTPNATTTYTVTGTAANGCTNTAQTTVTVYALPTVGAGANQTVCAGAQVTLSGSGASTYTWDNGITNAVAFTPNATTTYTVTGTAANGCTNTAQTTVTVNALPTVGAGANQTVCAGAQVTLSGSGASTYTWDNGITNAVAFTPNATTTYTVTGTAANGCTNTAQTTVTVNALPTVGAGANQTVCAGAQVTLSGSGASTYTWDNGVTNAVSFTPNATTTYTVTGTAANGCTNTAQTTVTVNALPTVGAGANQTVCNGTQLTLSGSGASTYTWDNGVTNAVAFTPNATTTYTVTGTAANGCTNTAQTTVTVNALPTVGAGANQTVCAGAQVTLSGSGASTYTWDNGITNAVAFTPNATTTYTVTGTAANGCTNTAQTTVTVNALPTVGAGANQTVCAGAQVTLSGSGASTYTWDNGVTNAVSFTPNATTTYTVTGTAANGCTNTAQTTVTVNALPTVGAGANQTVCAGTAVTLNGTGATSYTWNNGVSNGVVFTPAATQTYTVTGTNANGCSNTAQVTVTVNALPTVGAGANQTVCAGTAVTLNGTGATSYTWNNGVSNGVVFTPAATQTYTVTGTNANGCSNTAQVTVTVNALPTVGAGANQTVCAGAQVTLSGSGAQTYSWNNGVTNAVAFTPNATTIYTVTGTAANGCTNTAQTTVTVNALPTVGAGSNQTVCAGAQVTLSGSGAQTYSWNNGVTNAVAFTPNATTTYTVTGTAANGCTNTAQTTVTVNALPNVNAGNNISICFGDSVLLSATGASTYSWTGGIQNGSYVTPSSTQTYNVTGVDDLGCSNTDALTVTVNQATSSTITTSACNSYILNGQTYNQSGTYTQVIPNALGCDSTITLNLTINLPPTVPVITLSNGVELISSTQDNVSYQWIFCNSGLPIANATDTMFTATINGNFAVQVTNGCGTATSNCILIENVGLGNVVQEVLSLYPNPTMQWIAIEGLKGQETPYELMDAQGRVIRKGVLGINDPKLDVSTFANGIYWLTLLGYKPMEIIKQ